MMNNMMMQDVEQPQPQQQQAQVHSPEEIAGGHRSLDAVMDGLAKLVGLPRGDLTKKAIYDETSDMIANGAFPTKEAKQQLIGELANLPDDEEGMRKVLGEHLFQVAMFRNHFHNAFGSGVEQ